MFLKCADKKQEGNYTYKRKANPARDLVIYELFFKTNVYNFLRIHKKAQVKIHWNTVVGKQ